MDIENILPTRVSVDDVLIDGYDVEVTLAPRLYLTDPYSSPLQNVHTLYFMSLVGSVVIRSQKEEGPILFMNTYPEEAILEAIPLEAIHRSTPEELIEHVRASLPAARSIEEVQELLRWSKVAPFIHKIAAAFQEGSIEKVPYPYFLFEGNKLVDYGPKHSRIDKTYHLLFNENQGIVQFNPHKGLLYLPVRWYMKHSYPLPLKVEGLFKKGVLLLDQRKGLVLVENHHTTNLLAELTQRHMIPTKLDVATYSPEFEDALRSFTNSHAPFDILKHLFRPTYPIHNAMTASITDHLACIKSLVSTSYSNGSFKVRLSYDGIHLLHARISATQETILLSVYRTRSEVPVARPYPSFTHLLDPDETFSRLVTSLFIQLVYLTFHIYAGSAYGARLPLVRLWEEGSYEVFLAGTSSAEDSISDAISSRGYQDLSDSIIITKSVDKSTLHPRRSAVLVLPLFPTAASELEKGHSLTLSINLRDKRIKLSRGYLRSLAGRACHTDDQTQLDAKNKLYSPPDQSDTTLSKMLIVESMPLLDYIDTSDYTFTTTPSGPT